MIRLNPKDRPILLEALEELLYKVSLELNALEGGPLTPERKALTRKQAQIEAIQHTITSQNAG